MRAETSTPRTKRRQQPTCLTFCTNVCYVEKFTTIT